MAPSRPWTRRRKAVASDRQGTQRRKCLCKVWPKPAVISTIILLSVLASCLGHFLALNTSGKVIDIHPQRVRASRATELLLPLTGAASSILQYFPGHQSRMARTAQVWHARALAAARATQAASAAVQPVVMNNGAYSVRWRFLDAQGNVVDLPAARRAASSWVGGAAGATVARIARPTQVQFEWVVRTNELQSAGFDGYVDGHCSG